MIVRGKNFKQVPINIAGSSVFGRYPKISIEKTWNMFVSDAFLVPYAGYQISVSSTQLANSKQGRGIHASTKFNRLFVVLDSNVYMLNISFNQINLTTTATQISLIGNLQTTSGVVYITENNKPQILISDGTQLYVYDPTQTPNFQIATKDGTNPISFTPGYIDFHDTYFLCAASNDMGVANVSNNTWRLSAQNNGLLWPDGSANIGLLQTKPDNIQAVVRFPSRGNMIFVMGKTVSEPWYDVGYQLFPYNRSNSYSVDYGCLNPATIASMDEIVVWLAANEKSGPIIMYSTGGEPKKITTDGIDYLFSQLANPSDSQGFLYRQDGHLFYHINFYTDNLSIFYDFNTDKIYNASDENLNYFIAAQVAFFNNQYYFITKNSGNIFAFDTIFTQYQDVDELGNQVTFEIPRMRSCKNIRAPSQEYHVANDVGFTIETGETNYQTPQQNTLGPVFLITQDSQFIITQSSAVFFVFQNGNFIQTQDGNLLISQNFNSGDFSFLILTQQSQFLPMPPFVGVTPRVDLSLSFDGGASFGSDFPYWLNPIGLRKNKLMWWQLGAFNDLVCQFKFWGIGRFVATDGIINIRQ